MFDCTPGTFKSSIGDTTAGFQATWYLLNVKGTGTGDGLQSATAKATTPTTPYGKAPTPYGNASFITGMQRYLNVIHPWTTGFASVQNWLGSFVFTPQAQGYDTNLGDADITVTHYDWNANWNKTLSTVTTTTVTTKQYLYGVGRIVSMVRPRLIHTYTVPLDTVNDPIENTWNVARMWRLKVFFLSEPCTDCSIDNCLDASNLGQDDTDRDDCGNLCDADYDNNGIVGFPDFGQFVGAFGTNDEEKCHNEPIPGCTVGFADFGFFVSAFGSPPGPSGTTAGTIACP
jgi:hypothetical protein